jgi:two-component system response regulator NreC
MTAELHAVPPLSDATPDGTEVRPIRLVLADEHPLMRRSLRALLEREADVEVVAEADALADAIGRVQSSAPDVLVLDLRMRDGSSIQAIGDLREQMPDTRVVVMTADDNPLFAEHALAAGALGFVLKEHADVELPAAVRAAARGGRFVSAHVEAKLAAYRGQRGDDRLSARELEVLRLIALGHTSVGVARILEISPRTVESHRARIQAKLDVTSRAELVRHALRRGLLGL